MRVEDFEVAARYGVNPAYVAAIALVESEGGKTGYAAKGTYNPYGWGIYQGLKYPSWSKATEAVAKGLSGPLYRGAGLRDALSIAKKYAPSSDGNNPAAYARKVHQLMRQFGANPNQLFGGAQAINAAAARQAGVTPPPDLATAENESGGPDLATSVAGSILSRRPGQSLLSAVTEGAVQAALSTVGQPAVSPSEGLRKNPVGGAPAPGADGVVGAAKRWLGTPYSWGGGTPSGPTRGFGRGANTVGFDCSSLVQHAWAQVGVKLPRTTYDQIKFGRAVNPRNMAEWRPGDLVFPHRGHVQMYIGNGKVIEAPRTGGHVQIVPARSSYIAVRRPRG